MAKVTPSLKVNLHLGCIREKLAVGKIDIFKLERTLATENQSS